MQNVLFFSQIADYLSNLVILNILIVPSDSYHACIKSNIALESLFS